MLCNLLIEKGADQDWEKGVSVTPRFMGQISENSIINNIFKLPCSNLDEYESYLTGEEEDYNDFD